LKTRAKMVRTPILQLLWLALRRAFWAIIAIALCTDVFAFSLTHQRACFRCQRTCVALHETAAADSSKLTPLIDSVIEGMDVLFPRQGLDERIALSRKDGYWPFIKAGEDPPQEFVYGEFEFLLLEKSLEKARELLGKQDEDIVFCDLGSGTGRLVIATAALHPTWKLCRGIELLESIYEDAVEKLQSCRREATSDDNPEANDDAEEDDETNDQTSTDEDVPSGMNLSLPSDDGPLPLAPIQLECGSFLDPYSSFCDANVLFCFSSCLPKHLLIELARSIGRQALPGTIVITTEYQLPLGGVLDPLPDDPGYPSGEYEFELVDTFSGDCTAVGGVSTVFIHRVVKSVGTGERRIQPPIPVSELAFRAVQYMEDSDPKIFVRQVSNQMAFLGFPDSWRPKI